MIHRLEYRLTICEIMNITVTRVKPVSAILTVCPYYATALLYNTESIFTDHFRAAGRCQGAKTARIIDVFTQKMDGAIGKQEVTTAEMQTAKGIRMTAIYALISDQ